MNMPSRVLIAVATTAAIAASVAGALGLNVNPVALKPQRTLAVGRPDQPKIWPVAMRRGPDEAGGFHQLRERDKPRNAPPPEPRPKEDRAKIDAAAGGVKVGEIGNWDIKINVQIEDIKGFFSDVGKYASRAWGSIFTRHETHQQIFTIGGKHILAVPLNSDAGGSRIGDNFTADPAWSSNTWVHVVVANVPDGSDPGAMKFQQKYDSDWDEDPNVGPIMKHGDHVLFEPGHGRYLAGRSDTKYWGAVILFVEDGITPDQLQELPGNIKVSQRTPAESESARLRAIECGIPLPTLDLAVGGDQPHHDVR